MDRGPWTVDSEPWTVDRGLWTVDCEPWMCGEREIDVGLLNARLVGSRVRIRGVVWI